MRAPYETSIGSWTRRSTFFWAATGATVGFSNLWQFPYLAHKHGGGLFVLLYIACLLLVTLPLMLTEAAVGRHSRHGIVLTMDGFIRQGRLSRGWMWVGRFSVLAAFVVLSFTAVIGAICLAYVFFGALGTFTGQGEAEVVEVLANLVSDRNSYRQFMGWHGFFLLLVLWVSMQGVALGLERTLRVVVPGLYLTLLVFLGYSVSQGDLQASAGYLLSFRPEDLGWRSLQLALFHAFFTLGLGMGVWAVFGAYMAKTTPLKRAVFGVVLMDTLFAIVAGLAIYALVLPVSAGAGEQGFGLLFVALPLSLAEVPGSQFVIAAVYLMIVLVAWTTALALLEPLVGWFREWTGAPRGWSVTVIGVLVWLAGLATLFSFNIWSDVLLLGGSIFRWLELIASGLLIPLVSILLAVFVGWKLSHPVAFGLIGQAPWLISRIWFWVMRLVLPVVVAYIGVQYSIHSLNELCGDGEVRGVCQPINAIRSQPPVDELPALPDTPEVPEAPGAPAEDSGPGVWPPEAPAAGQSPAPEGAEPPAGDKGQQREREILYHSA
ncbi:sodium-dependent transporter [Marinobacter zhejiangensis]|nr:sodium-dependent transporter [Marinobacter zhejiangensis]